MGESESNIIEKLAKLEHEQWCHWTRYFIRGKHTPDDLYRWVHQMDMPYEDLPEEDKEKDRMWARRVYKVIQCGQ